MRLLLAIMWVLHWLPLCLVLWCCVVVELATALASAASALCVCALCASVWRSLESGGCRHGCHPHDAAL